MFGSEALSGTRRGVERVEEVLLDASVVRPLERSS